MLTNGLAGMKITFIAGTLGGGGAERQLYYILRVLQQSGARVRLLCLTKGELWEEPIRKLGVPVVWVGQQKSKCVRLFRILHELRQDLPDIVQSQHFYTNLYVVMAARLLGSHNIGAIRNDGFSELRANGPILGNLSLRTPFLLAANSRCAIENVTRLGVAPMRLQLLTNVVDTDLFNYIPRQNAKEIKLLSAGRLVKAKRMDRYIRLIHSLKTSGAPSTGLLVGDGIERQSLEQLSVNLGLCGGSLSFMPYCENMSSLYSQADIYVLTSDWEGTPNVILEAMASGLPIVATRVGGVSDIVEHGVTGFLSDPNDEDSMIDALKLLVRDSALRSEMGQKAREYVLKHHSLHTLPNQLLKLYRAALVGN